jgi:hypothetical protein
MSAEFKLYRFKKFPISFVYPSYAKYHRFNEKKHFKQVNFREEKDKYRSDGCGRVVFIYPKLSVSVLRAHVPSYQTSKKHAYFMAFKAYLENIVGLEAMKNAFPDLICSGRCNYPNNQSQAKYI